MTRGLSVFIIIWLGQLVSLIGSELTAFALGIWVYQKTGSVTEYTLISLFTLLPGLFISPVAGALIDRLSRRWVMIFRLKIYYCTTGAFRIIDFLCDY